MGRPNGRPLEERVDVDGVEERAAAVAVVAAEAAEGREEARGDDERAAGDGGRVEEQMAVATASAWLHCTRSLVRTLVSQSVCILKAVTSGSSGLDTGH